MTNPYEPPMSSPTKPECGCTVCILDGFLIGMAGMKPTQ